MIADSNHLVRKSLITIKNFLKTFDIIPRSRIKHQDIISKKNKGGVIPPLVVVMGDGPVFTPLF